MSDSKTPFEFESALGELEQLVARLTQEKRRKDAELAELAAENKRLRADFDKTLSKEKLAELIED